MNWIKRPFYPLQINEIFIAWIDIFKFLMKNFYILFATKYVFVGNNSLKMYSSNVVKIFKIIHCSIQAQFNVTFHQIILIKYEEVIALQQQRLLIYRKALDKPWTTRIMRKGMRKPFVLYTYEKLNGESWLESLSTYFYKVCWLRSQSCFSFSKLHAHIVQTLWICNSGKVRSNLKLRIDMILIVIHAIDKLHTHAQANAYCYQSLKKSDATYLIMW